ncbi:Uncharacterised protein [uncultured archaeon]|nr:Uncharacterised protein [uncultured archaeon]
MDGPITITSNDIVDYTVLYRKRHETIFRHDYMARHSAGKDDPAIGALKTQLGEVEAKLKPLEERIRQVDLVMVVPKRADLISINAEINQHSREELDAALKSRSGAVYELLRKRADITKSNYERREEIARLTILLNMLPRTQAENLRTVVESSAAQDVTLAALTAEQQQEMVTLLGRLGVSAFVSEGLLSRDKKKADDLNCLAWTEEIPKTIGGGAGSNSAALWVPKDRMAEWEENEKHLADIGRKIQTKLAKSQADGLNDDEQKEFESLQKLYLELRTRRHSIANVKGPICVSLPKADRPPVHAPLPTIDLGPGSAPAA